VSVRLARLTVANRRDPRRAQARGDRRFLRVRAPRFAAPERAAALFVRAAADRDEGLRFAAA